MKNKFTIFLVLLLALSLGIQSAVAKKPLTTITFDEVPLQGFVTLYVKGVTFEYDNLGAVAAADFGNGYLTAQSAGQLTLIFDKPTTVVEFDFWLSTIEYVEVAVVADLYGPGEGKLRETLTAQAMEGVTSASRGHFTYQGPAIQRAVLYFSEGPSYANFGMDNLVFHG